MLSTRALGTTLALVCAAAVAWTGRTHAQPAVEAARPIDPKGVTLPAPAASASQRQFSFIVYGDTRGPADGQLLQPEHGDVVNGMLTAITQQRDGRFPVRFVVQTGDAVTSGRVGRQWNVSFTPLIERLIVEGGVPYLFAVGNHDVTTATELTSVARREGLANTYAAMSKIWPAEGRPDRMTGYPTYSFVYGQWLFIVLDSNIAGDREQVQWVTARLESIDRSRYPYVAMVFHHPILTSGPHGGPIVEPQSAALRRLYLPLFRQHHVRIVFAGHDHLFDHFIEHYADDSGSHRLDHIVTGGGGAPIYSYAGEQDLELYTSAAAPQRVSVQHPIRPGLDQSANPHHFVIVQVDGARLRLRVVTTTAAPLPPYGADGVSLDDVQ